MDGVARGEEKMVVVQYDFESEWELLDAVMCGAESQRLQQLPDVSHLEKQAVSSFVG